MIIGQHFRNVADLQQCSYPIGWTRTLNFDADDYKGLAWASIEKSPQVYDWRELDKLVDYCYLHKIGLVYTVYGTPSFYVKYPDRDSPWNIKGFTSPVKNITPLKNFIETLCSRYKGKRIVIETQNEPDLGFYLYDKSYWAGTKGELLEWCNTIYDSVKKRFPVTSPGIIWWEQGVPQNLRDFFIGLKYDIAAIHVYHSPSVVLNAARQAQTKPVWITECGALDGQVMSPSMLLDWTQELKTAPVCIYYRHDLANGGFPNSSQIMSDAYKQAFFTGITMEDIDQIIDERIQNAIKQIMSALQTEIETIKKDILALSNQVGQTGEIQLAELRVNAPLTLQLTDVTLKVDGTSITVEKV